MTCLRPTSNSIETAVETYLRRFARVAPESTYVSHQTTLRKFARWLQNQGVSCQPNERSVAAFAVTMLPDYSPTTIRGDLDTIANFLGYYLQTDPGLVKIRVAFYLEHEEVDESHEGKLLELVSLLRPARVDHESVETVVSAIDQRKYGNRIHAFVSLLLDTKGHPTLIRQLDLQDLDLEAGTVEVKVSKSHAICKAGLMNRRVASLTYPTRNVLDTYLEYERNEISGNSLPLFTTAHGRVSESTLRHTLKKVCDEMASEELNQPILPLDIWRYAVSKFAYRA